MFWWFFGVKYGWILVIGLLFGFFYVVWRKYGKDDKVILVINYYFFENINFVLVGYLIDDSGDIFDLIFLLLYWGV